MHENLQIKKNSVPLQSDSAEVAQLVERNLAKVEVASSNLVFRSHSRVRTSFSAHIPGVIGIGFFFEFRKGTVSFFMKRTRGSLAEDCLRSVSPEFQVAPMVESVDTQDLKSCG